MYLYISFDIDNYTKIAKEFNFCEIYNLGSLKNYLIKSNNSLYALKQFRYMLNTIFYEYYQMRDIRMSLLFIFKKKIKN